MDILYMINIFFEKNICLNNLHLYPIENMIVYFMENLNYETSSN